LRTLMNLKKQNKKDLNKMESQEISRILKETHTRNRATALLEVVEEGIKEARKENDAIKLAFYRGSLKTIELIMEN